MKYSSWTNIQIYLTKSKPRMVSLLCLLLLFICNLHAQTEYQNGYALSRVTSDFTTTNTTATTVSGLTFAIGANQTWTFECWMKNGASLVTGNKFAVSVPSGATVMASVLGTSTAAGTTTWEAISSSASLTTTAFNTAGLTTAAIGAFCVIQGTIVNGATSGTVAIQVAKVVSGTATVYQNSYIIAREFY